MTKPLELVVESVFPILLKEIFVDQHWPCFSSLSAMREQLEDDSIVLVIVPLVDPGLMASHIRLDVVWSVRLFPLGIHSIIRLQIPAPSSIIGLNQFEAKKKNAPSLICETT